MSVCKDMIKTEDMQEMSPDEKYLEARFGKPNPFKTPDGFLDGLADSIINNVERSVANEVPCMAGGDAHVAIGVRHAWWARYRRYVAAAACLVLVAVGAAVYFAAAGPERTNAYAASARHGAEATSSYTYDEIADYTMLDNDDIYSLLASN